MSDCYDRDNIRETLKHNLGSICTIYTESGGRSGDGFTGVLSEVGRSTCKLIATNDLPRGDFYCNDSFRRIQTIPIDKIACIATSHY